MNNLVNEILKEIIQNSRIITEAGEEGAGERERVLRLPNVFASEISVGQKPNSEERSAFQTWMQHIEGATPDEKIKNVQAFFESDVENYTISETLSHLMFMNSFVFIMKEFNPSVSGFLWEPLLAGLFGGEGGYGKQIPAGTEHDIADIRVYKADGTEEPYSLKVLSGGNVKGSFTDLANHFKLRSTEPMIYEIVHKGDESTMRFYKFAITEETVWEHLGGYKFVETLETAEETFIMNPEASGGIVQYSEDKKQILVRHAGQGQGGGSYKGKYLPVGTLKKGGVYKASSVQPYVNNAKKMGLALNGVPVEKGHVFDMTAEYTAGLAKYGEEGEVAQAHKATEARTPMSKKVWGNDKQYAYWQQRYRDLSWREFWAEVADETTGAPGYVNTKQFVVPEAQWRKGANAYAELKIDSAKVQAIFEKSAARMGAELTAMFNHLADLTDNIGRFFLSNCGGPQKVQKCSKKDANNRGTAATEAKENATNLKTAVDASIEKAAADDAVAVQESKRPIVLDKLIEQMLNKSFN